MVQTWLLFSVMGTNKNKGNTRNWIPSENIYELYKRCKRPKLLVDTWKSETSLLSEDMKDIKLYMHGKS